MSTAAVVKIAILLLILVAVIIRTIRRRARMAADSTALAANAEVMRGLRLHALQYIPDDLDETIGADQPYAIIMDIGTPNGAASVFAAISGDASIYTTSGAGLLGGIGHDNVRRAAIAFVNEAARCREHLKPADDYAYPADGNVHFYVRTRDALYVTTDRTEESLGTKTDLLWPLFYAGQEVITQFRRVAPDFGR